MPSCQFIDSLVTPYVDDEVANSDRVLVEEHLQACASCHSRVVAERAVRALIQARKPALQHECAPPALRQKCAAAADVNVAAPLTADLMIRPTPVDAQPPSRLWRFREPRRSEGGGGALRPASAWRARLAPVSLAAVLTLIVGVAFLYQLTEWSATVLAVELTADHVKCFALNKVLGTHQGSAVVERSMAAGFGWQARLPDRPERVGLELVGARPCLYGEGLMAHIMYRHRGRPLSVFMLPHTVRTESLLKVLGHQCAIWSSGDRTFALVAREPENEVKRIASFVQASLR